MEKIMRRKVFGVVLAASLMASLVACGGNKDNNSSSNGASTVNTEMTAEEYAASITSNAAVYKNYLTLPEYKGISVSVDKSTLTVSDDDVESYISSLLSQYSTTDSVTEGVTASGDTIVLDYSGLLDGVAFSGGTATDVTYTIGSGKFIDDLDKGLVGLTVGQEYQLPCTFPSDYSSSDLAGKSVIFVVTVSSIQKTTIPELTDAWVAENASSFGIEESVTTAAQLRSYVREYLETQAQSSYDSSKYEAIWSSISENMNPSGYPQEELDDLVETLTANIQSEFDSYGSYYGVSDLESYVTQVYGFDDMDDFNNYAVEYAQEYLLEKMALTLIADQENITVTADEINDMGAQLADYYGYTDYQEILDTYGNEMNAEVGYEVLYNKVQEFLNENAVEQ
jgi:trigger factor